MPDPKAKPQALKPMVPTPAPGDLSLVQSLLNTAPSPSRSEAFGDPAMMKRWFADHGLLAADTTLTEDDRERVLELRQALLALVAASHGTPIPEPELEILDGAIRQSWPQLRFDRNGHLASASRAGTLDEACGHLLALFLLARLQGEWHRLAICKNDECRTVFYNDSTRRERLWCHQRCSARIRARTYRRSAGYKYWRQAGRKE